MAPNLLLQALEQFGDGFEFERLCNDIMHLHYSKFTPGGQVHDLGVDGLVKFADDDDIRIYSKTSKNPQQTFVFQYSIQETWETKIKNTLSKLKSNKIEYDQFVYVTNQNPTTTATIKMQIETQKKYQKPLIIHAQEFLRVFLENPEFSYLVDKYFASYLAQLKRLEVESSIFANVSLADRYKRRALVLLSTCVRSHEGQEVRDSATDEIILGCLYGEDGKSEHSIDDIQQELLKTFGDESLISEDILQSTLANLTSTDKIQKTANGYCLSEGELNRIEAKIGRSYEEDAAFYTPLVNDPELCDNIDSDQKQQIRMAIAKGIGVIFERKGLEIANALCDNCETASLNDYPEITLIAKEVTSSLSLQSKEAAEKILRRLFTNPTTFEAEYLFGIAESYLVYASFNLDADARMLDLQSVRENILIIDTDILLAALVGKEDRQNLYQSMLKATKNLGVAMYTLPQMLHEFVYKINRSHEEYIYMKRPSRLTSDVLDDLGVVFRTYFKRVASTGRSWDQFIRSLIGDSTDPAKREAFVKNRLEMEYGIQTHSFSSEFVPAKDDIEAFARAISMERERHQTYKHDDLYETDAFVALLVDGLQIAHPERHYWLLSNDSHLRRVWQKRVPKDQPVRWFPPQSWFQYVTNHPASKSTPVDFAVLMKSLNVSPSRPKIPRNLLLTLIRFGVNVSQYSVKALEELNKRLYQEYVWKEVITKRTSEISEEEVSELEKSLDRVLKGIEKEVTPDRIELKERLKNSELAIKDLASEKDKMAEELLKYQEKEEKRRKYKEKMKKKKAEKRKKRPY